MNKETLEFAKRLESNIRQCEDALEANVDGIYYTDYATSCCKTGTKRLPKEVCNEIKDVIVKWKEDYQMQLEEL